MTSTETPWQPDLLHGHPVKHIAITRGIAQAIERGELRAGDRLPTHRALARQLGVTVGTVSRAYAEAAKLGLITGEVGRGSFVRHRPPARFDWSTPDGVAPGVDLSQNFPVAVPLEREALERTFAQNAHNLAARTSCKWNHIEERVSEAGRRWLQAAGAPCDEPPFVVHGPQAALSVALAATTQPGDVLLAAESTHPGLRALAASLHLQVVGLSMDDEGIEPAALERACQEFRPRALFCQPTLQTPRTVIMSAQRRRDLASILQRRRVTVIELDDSSTLLPAPPAALASELPERTLLIADTTRALSFGLRTSFVRVPQFLRERFESAYTSQVWMGVPLLASTVADWILDGTAKAVLAARAQELEERHALCRSLLSSLDMNSHPRAHHLWIRLHNGLRGEVLVADAARMGIGLTPAEWFHTGSRHAPDALRLCYGAAASTEVLREALQRLVGLFPVASPQRAPVAVPGH